MDPLTAFEGTAFALTVLGEEVDHWFIVGAFLIAVCSGCFICCWWCVLPLREERRVREVDAVEVKKRWGGAALMQPKQSIFAAFAPAAAVLPPLKLVTGVVISPTRSPHENGSDRSPEDICLSPHRIEIRSCPNLNGTNAPSALLSSALSAAPNKAAVPTESSRSSSSTNELQLEQNTEDEELQLEQNTEDEELQLEQNSEDTDLQLEQSVEKDEPYLEENIEIGRGRSVSQAQSKLTQLKGILHHGFGPAPTGAASRAMHTCAHAECLAFIKLINRRLEDDPSVAHLLPISTADATALFDAVTDGGILCKLIDEAAPDTIDGRVIHVQPRNRLHVMENLNLAINAAKGIGLTVVNIGAVDLLEGKPDLVLSLVWQIVKMLLLSNINLRATPNLIRLLQEGETLESLLRLHPEKFLMRWVNYHLEAAGCDKRLHNWGPDLQDSQIYATLMKQIDPKKIVSVDILQQQDMAKRASYVVEQGTRLDAEFQIQPNDILVANKKLNLGFVAALFGACSGLDPLDEEEAALLRELPDEDVGDSREERAFRMWINSLGVDSRVNHLFDDLRDGCIILQTMDKVRPGVVDWPRVNKAPELVFKKIENLNYAVDLGISPFKFSLVGVQGNDIVSGNKKLTLALIWQLMRSHLVGFLDTLRKEAGGKGVGKPGQPLSDRDIIVWANETVASSPWLSGEASTIRDLNDASIASGLFLIDLLSAIAPRSVDRSHVTAGSTDEERKLNAKYAISSARKLGCSVFLLWEDIVEVRPKMILSFVAAVMAIALTEDRGSCSSGQRFWVL